MGTGETGLNANSFTFTLGGTPVRAACAGASFTSTCLDNPVPCLNPIFDTKLGTSIHSSLVTQLTGISSGSNDPISFPNASLVVGLYGTTDTNSQFGVGASNPPGSGGAFTNQGAGSNLTFLTGTAQNNGGISIGTLSEGFAGTDGPWRGSLPQLGAFPQIAISSMIESAGTVTATVVANPPLAQYQQPTFLGNIANSTGGTPPGCFNASGVTITPTGLNTFTYATPGGCSGTPVGGGTTHLDIIDPGLGDNVSQVVSIIPNLP